MIDVHALKQSHPIADVIAGAGVELRNAGRRLVGRCPLHADREPSLSVYPDTQSYFCYACGIGGDVIDFVCRQRNLDFKEAVRQLGAMTPIQCRALDRPRLSGSDAPLAPEVRHLLDVAVGLFEQALWHSDHARQALRRRGVGEATARRYRLGLGHASLAADLGREGLDLGTARDIGLLAGTRNVLGGRLVIPDFSDGSTAWLTARSINGELPRYLNLSLPTPLLGLSQVEEPDVLVTEGPFDWLTAVGWGLPAVALAGTRVSTTTVRPLSGFQRVFICLDNDVAGRRATGDLLDALPGSGIAVRLPDFAHDVNDLACLSDGPALFRSCLEEAVTGKEVPTWPSTPSASSRGA